MTAFGLILILLGSGIALAGCMMDGGKHKAADAPPQIEVRAPDVPIPARSDILQIEDRDPKTGRFDSPDTSPSGVDIVARWNAYRDADGRVYYGREYKPKK